ncbi:hypothetical protein BJX70DRAFT_409198 [Aspergillus crustosus]
MGTCEYSGCTAQYRRKEHLTRHARKHFPGLHRLTCEQCDKTFDRADSLRRHQQLHSREQQGQSLPRTTKACDQCHASKTRCNGQDPCNACSRRGVACQFNRESKRAAGRNPDSTVSGSDTGDSQLPRSDTMQDLILLHENKLREQGLLGAPDLVQATTKPTEPGGSDIDTDHYVDVYFDHFHYQWPMLHAHSFTLSKEPQILFLAVVMIGLWVTGDKAPRARAVTMHEKLLTLIETRMDTWRLNSAFTNKSWPMTTYQTIVLNIIFAIIRDASEDIHTRCNHLLRAVTTTCLTGGLFSYRKMRAQIEPTDSLLFTWTYLEEVKRLALTIFKLNAHFDTVILTPCDLQFPLPDSGYLWDSPGSKEFYRRYHAQLESDTFMNEGPLVSELFRGVRDGGMGVGLLMQADSWLGLATMAATQIQHPSQTLEMAISNLLLHHKLAAHGYKNHRNREYILDMDFWEQLESLQRLLCQRNPDLPFPEGLLVEMDNVIAHRNSHALLTSSSALAPSIIVNHSVERRTNKSVWKGDITSLSDVTAIVNAANSALLGCFQPSHKCIDNVIHSAAGPQAAERLPALPDGRKVLAFCCISTDLFAFPSDVAACIAVEPVVQWFVQHPETTITDIIFDTFLQYDYNLYNEKLCSLPTESDSAKVAKAPAGAGLSTATGLDYTSPELFAKHFPAFLPLGLRRLYDKWGYYFTHLGLVRNWPIASRFGSRCFVRTSNADGLFIANGFHPGRVSTPQGQYAYLQCLAKCRREAVFASALFLDAALPFLDPESQLLTDETKIPRCRYCSGELTLCVRGGDYFNPSPLLPQEREYSRFIDKISLNLQLGPPRNKTPAKAVILELGVGLNTPSVLRWPNEELVQGAPNREVRLVRVGFGAAGCAPWEFEEEGLAVGVDGDIGAVVGLLAGVLKGIHTLILYLTSMLRNSLTDIKWRTW